MRGRSVRRGPGGKGRGAVRAAAVGAWAVALLLTMGLGGALAGTRLIAHFENGSNADANGRDVLRVFYHSQGAGADVNLYPNTMGTNNLLPFPLISTTFTDGGALPGDPFEIHQFAADGTVPGPGFLIGENRFAAFGSGWALGAHDLVEDFQLNFINVANEDDDFRWRPGIPGLGNFLANNVVTGTVQDWSAYSDLCFYLCINSADIPAQQFFDDFVVQVWEYKIEPWPLPPPFDVTAHEREIYEVSLSDILAQNGVAPFTGWRHLRVPFSSFQRVAYDNTYWRYGRFITQDGYDGMNGTLDTDTIRAIIFRKGRVVDSGGNPTEPTDRVTVAIDEITVTGDTTAEVLRVNIPGELQENPSGEFRCDDNQDRGLCWAQVFATDTNVDNASYQVLPYTSPTRPATGGNRNVDVVVTVRDWEQFWATFSAEVGNGAVVSGDSGSFSSEIVFVPQFQAPGTWVQRGLVGPDFLRRKGTIHISAPPGRDSLFYTDWRYDYTNGVAAEKYLVHFNPTGATAFDRLDPSDAPQGGFLANYLREFGYAYGTLFVLPRDNQGNTGRAWVIDVLFEQSAGRLGYERLMTGRP